MTAMPRTIPTTDRKLTAAPNTWHNSDDTITAATMVTGADFLRNPNNRAKSPNSPVRMEQQRREHSDHRMILRFCLFHTIRMNVYC